jgi:putative FmdB family regulatory protein
MDRRAFVTGLAAVLAAPLAATAHGSDMIPLVKPPTRAFHHDVEEADAHGPGASRRGKNEGCIMPRYEFMCEKCNKPFELIMTFSEREKGDVKCPKCQGTKVVPQFSGFVAQTGKKS